MPYSTLDTVHEPTVRSSGVRARRIGTTVLTLFVLAGLVGVFGVRESTVHGSGGGYDVSVHHASVARAGSDVPWRVTIRREDGFDSAVTLALTADYLRIYEHQGWFPEPTDQTRDGEWLYLTFAAPQGPELVIDLDAYVQPNAPVGAGGEVSVVDADGALVAVTKFSTRLVP